MKDQFVSYDLALKLKELGFDEKCLARFPHTTIKYSLENNLDPNNALLIGVYSPIDLPAPLYQQAIDYIFDKFSIHIDVYPIKVSAADKFGFRFSYCISTPDLILEEDISPLGFLERNEAREVAILKAIELCQNKKN